MKTMTMTWMGLGMMAALGWAQPVQAGYSCTSYDESAQLELTEKDGYHVLLKDAQGAKEFQATLEQGNSVLFTRSVFQLVSTDGVSAKLTVVTRVSCGRGGCDSKGAKTISAKLLTGETELGFYCEDTVE
jgi:hypothetical protein